MDACPTTMEAVKDLKKFVYRALHVFSMRLCLLSRIVLDDFEVLPEDGWSRLFDLFTCPGLHKVLGFAKLCKEKLPDTPAKKRLLEDLASFSQRCAEFVADLLYEEKQSKKNVDHLVRDSVRDCNRQFSGIVHLITEDMKPQFSAVWSTQDLRWLLETGKFDRAIEAACRG